MRCVLVTGLSGAGRSTALRQLEDMGYFCVDNLPPQMMATFISMCQCENIEKVALVVDSRTRMFFADIYKAMDDLKNMGVQMEILYLETADEVLIRRYKETRRKHPMGTNTIMQGIAVERQRLGELRNMAQHIIDTSTMSAKQLSISAIPSCLSSFRLGLKTASRGMPIWCSMFAFCQIRFTIRRFAR